MTLKELLGDKYHNDMTFAEVEKALEGKNLADLSTGRYVDKDKYDKAVNDLKDKSTAFDELTTNTKDYEELKKFKEDTEIANTKKARRDKLKEAGFKEEYLDYADFLVESGKFKDDDKLVDNARLFLDENKQYGVEKQATPPNGVNPNIKINTKVGDDPAKHDDLGMPKIVANHSWNK